MNSKYMKTIFNDILSSRDDENFKIIRILEGNDRIIVDIRQTFKGKFLSEGFTLLFNEFVWINETLSSEESKIFKLEHNNRIICVNKQDANVCLVSMQKGNAPEKKLILTLKECETFNQIFKTVKAKMEERMRQLEIPTEFEKTAFLRYTVE